MKDLVKKKVVDTERNKGYNLDHQQLKKLILDKFERAKMYHEALKKREALLVESR